MNLHQKVDYVVNGVFEGKEIKKYTLRLRSRIRNSLKVSFYFVTHMFVINFNLLFKSFSTLNLQIELKSEKSNFWMEKWSTF